MAFPELVIRPDEGGEVSVRPIEFAVISTFPFATQKESREKPIDLRFQGMDATIDGERQNGIATVTAKLTLSGAQMPYALVEGGWLPMPFVSPSRYLVDRNIVSRLRNTRAKSPVASQITVPEWRSFLNRADATYNPILYAFEGSHRRLPTHEEFKIAYQEGAKELKTAFPLSHIVEHSEGTFSSAYRQLVDLSDRGEREARFLVSVVPLIIQRVPRGKEESILVRILEIARELQVWKNALVVLAAISVLYEDIQGKIPAVGRGLIKPRLQYSIEDARNAVNDIRHAEIAAIGHTLSKNERFALCTLDFALARFWCELQFRGADQGSNVVETRYSLGNGLFYRLNPDEFRKLLEVLEVDAEHEPILVSE